MKCVELDPKLAPAKRSDVPNSEAKSAQVYFEGYAKDTDTRMQLEMSHTGDYSEDVAYRPSATFKQQVASLGSDELIHCKENNGIFSAALTAYNKHRNTGNYELPLTTGGFVSLNEFLSPLIKTVPKMLFARCLLTTKAKRP